MEDPDGTLAEDGESSAEETETEEAPAVMPLIKAPSVRAAAAFDPNSCDTNGVIDMAAKGIKVNFFDYGPTSIDRGWASTNSDKNNTGINSGKTLKFFQNGLNHGDSTAFPQSQDYNNWTGSPNWNNKTGAAANQGIVQNTLVGGYPKLAVGNKDNLAYLFDPDSTDANTAYRTDYLNVNGLLKKVSGSSSEYKVGYNCLDNYAYLDSDGKAFILSSITRPGPFGLCGATGVGIQHVGALIDRAGSGVTQIIGTGGADLKVGDGITMLSGIDALEDDPATKYIVLVSRKPRDEILAKILDRVKQCKKPVVGCFMGADPAVVEASGAICASDLDDAAVKALALVGKTCDLQTDEELDRIAAETVQGMAPGQKYLRGLFTGGTYMEEAMRAITPIAGRVYSNAPLSEELRLADSLVSVENTCVDVGEDEFTMGKPHPTMEPSGRKPFIVKEGSDPEVCTLLLDFIFAVSANTDPVGVVLEDIRAAMANAKAHGGRLAVVAALCGTDSDFQNYAEQKRKLEEAGVYVCQTNRLAAKLAANITALQNGGKA